MALPLGLAGGAYFRSKPTPRHGQSVLLPPPPPPALCRISFTRSGHHPDARASVIRGTAVPPAETGICARASTAAAKVLASQAPGSATAKVDGAGVRALRKTSVTAWIARAMGRASTARASAPAGGAAAPATFVTHATTWPVTMAAPATAMGSAIASPGTRAIAV
jgi:hypothetical protein